MTGMPWLDALLANPVFAGVGGAALMSAALYQARALPQQLWTWTKRTLLVELEIEVHRRGQLVGNRQRTRRTQRGIGRPQGRAGGDDVIDHEHTPTGRRGVAHSSASRASPRSTR